MAVISFVMLAIGRRCRLWLAASTSPVAAFWTTKARAETVGPAALEGAQRRRPATSAGASGKQRFTGAKGTGSTGSRGGPGRDPGSYQPEVARTSALRRAASAAAALFQSAVPTARKA